MALDEKCFVFDLLFFYLNDHVLSTVSPKGLLMLQIEALPLTLMTAVLSPPHALSGMLLAEASIVDVSQIPRAVLISRLSVELLELRS